MNHPANRNGSLINEPFLLARDAFVGDCYVGDCYVGDAYMRPQLSIRRVPDDLFYPKHRHRILCKLDERTKVESQCDCRDEKHKKDKRI